MTECSSTLGSTISSGVMTYEAEAVQSLVLIHRIRDQLVVAVAPASNRPFRTS